MRQEIKEYVQFSTGPDCLLFSAPVRVCLKSRQPRNVSLHMRQLVKLAPGIMTKMWPQRASGFPALQLHFRAQDEGARCAALGQ
ncbi:hypothetical protein PTE30175_00381 [Pandoraea terrae]|uniref:Uncharacterized protein n=1 Tax=Pandoraea terrae TaxID=1537710 RepID=A0A5E4RXV7_9BURK|nr:hypothetical protein PTE30175_00381 [Pandoraea terrae]